MALDDVITTGEPINSDISQRLIEAIFFKNAPLHDGAMVIRGGRIVAAQCILPVSHNLNIPRRLGLRHRSAMGVSEMSDAIAIVVSEETGIISIVKQGNVERFPDTEMLTKVLRDYYWQELPLTEKKAKVVISK